MTKKATSQPRQYDKPVRSITFTLPPNLIEWLTEYAKGQATSRSAVVAEVLELLRRSDAGGQVGTADAMKRRIQVLEQMLADAVDDGTAR